MGKLDRYYAGIRFKSRIIQDDINDICLELNDININTIIKQNRYGYTLEIQHKLQKIMKYSDVNPVVQRLSFYLTKHNYTVSYKYTYSDSPKFFSNILNKLRGKIYFITIKFDECMPPEISKFMDGIIKNK